MKEGHQVCILATDKKKKGQNSNELWFRRPSMRCRTAVHCGRSGLSCFKSQLHKILSRYVKIKEFQKFGNMSSLWKQSIKKGEFVYKYVVNWNKIEATSPWVCRHQACTPPTCTMVEEGTFWIKFIFSKNATMIWIPSFAMTLSYLVSNCRMALGT